MKISVIIPTFNRKKTLERAIQSVMNQSLSPFEILIIDDGSNDGTEEWIKENFQNIKYIYQNNHGVSSARNIGIENAYGDWGIFFIITAVMVIPSLIFLYMIKDKLKLNE